MAKDRDEDDKIVEIIRRWKLFTAADADGSGGIDINGLQSMGQSMGQILTDKEAGEIMTGIDLKEIAAVLRAAGAAEAADDDAGGEAAADDDAGGEAADDDAGGEAADDNAGGEAADDSEGKAQEGGGMFPPLPVLAPSSPSLVQTGSQPVQSACPSLPTTIPYS